MNKAKHVIAMSTRIWNLLFGCANPNMVTLVMSMVRLRRREHPPSCLGDVAFHKTLWLKWFLFEQCICHNESMAQRRSQERHKVKTPYWSMSHVVNVVGGMKNILLSKEDKGPALLCILSLTLEACPKEMLGWQESGPHKDRSKWS